MEALEKRERYQKLIAVSLGALLGFVVGNKDFPDKEESSIPEYVPESISIPPSTFTGAMTAKNEDRIKALFEQVRDKSRVRATENLAEQKAASLDGEGRIIVKGDTVEVFKEPLTIQTYNFDITPQNTKFAADMVLQKDPDIFSLSGDEFQKAVMSALSPNSPGDIWYMPSAEIGHSESPVATYDMNSGRVCQPMVDAWQNATGTRVDCFPADDLKGDTQLERSIRLIMTQLAAPDPTGP